jgi:hypothetical protein
MASSALELTTLVHAMARSALELVLVANMSSLELIRVAALRHGCAGVGVLWP